MPEESPITKRVLIDTLESLTSIPDDAVVHLSAGFFAKHPMFGAYYREDNVLMLCDKINAPE
jgi:hypothetical protein